MHPFAEDFPAVASEIANAITTAATTPRTPPIIHFSRCESTWGERIACAWPGGRTIAYNPKPAHENGWNLTAGDPTSSWTTPCGSSGTDRGSREKRLPFTNATT